MTLNTKYSYKLSYLAPVALIFVSFFWGATFPWVKRALVDFSPIYWVAFRFLLAAFLFGIVYFTRFSIRGIKQGCILGFVLGSAFVLQTIGIKYSSAATMGLLTGLILPFILVLETFIGKTKLKRSVKISLGIAFAGFLLLSWKSGISFGPADILGVFASLAFAYQIFLMARFAPKYNISTLNFYQMLVISVVAFVGAWIFEDFSSLDFGSAVAISSILFTAFVCSFFAFFIQTWAQRFVSSARTTLYFSLEPLFAAVVSWTVYYEEITFLKIVGAVLLLTAVGVVQERAIKSDE